MRRLLITMAITGDHSLINSSLAIINIVARHINNINFVFSLEQVYSFILGYKLS